MQWDSVPLSVQLIRLCMIQFVLKYAIQQATAESLKHSRYYTTLRRLNGPYRGNMETVTQKLFR